MIAPYRSNAVLRDQRLDGQGAERTTLAGRHASGEAEVAVPCTARADPMGLLKYTRVVHLVPPPPSFAPSPPQRQSAHLRPDQSWSSATPTTPQNTIRK